MRKWICLLLALALLCVSAASALELPQDTEGQRALAAYVDRVNGNLAALGAPPLNSVFMCFPTLADLGITQEDNAEIPEQVELTFQLYPNALNTLQLRVSDPDLFGVLAAACIEAASPGIEPLQNVYQAARAYADRVKKKPDSSFEDPVIEQNGTSVRAYYAYYIDQYHDKVNWLQMTLIFPLAGYEGAYLSATPAPTISQSDTEYEGIDYLDTYSHFEVFITPTPEPQWW